MNVTIAAPECVKRQQPGLGGSRAGCGGALLRQEIEQALGGERAARVVLVAEVAVDVETAGEQRTYPVRPLGQGGVIVGRLAEAEVPKRRCALETADARDACLVERAVDLVRLSPGRVIEIERVAERRVERVEQEREEAVVAGALELDVDGAEAVAERSRAPQNVGRSETSPPWLMRQLIFTAKRNGGGVCCAQRSNCCTAGSRRKAP